MAEILVVYTGGTICSFETGECRSLDVSRAKRIIENRFYENQDKLGINEEIIFKDSKIKKRTLSENMTMEKLCYIAGHIKNFDLSKYQGVIVLHGTDTLAYTAAFFSFIFSDTNTPIMLVSGHKPPDREGTNANDNFGMAVKLIVDGIAPNVYAVYKNTDGKMRLHLGATLMQCPNFSDNFENASDEKTFLCDEEGLFEKCRFYSKMRKKFNFGLEKRRGVLNILPYTGLDYKNIKLKKIGAVIHGTYHSGTVCVERNEAERKFGSGSILWFAKKCRKKNIPVFIVPSKLSKEQYSSVFDAAENGGVIPLCMTREAAYMKAYSGVMSGLAGNELAEFMKTEICCEFIKV